MSGRQDGQAVFVTDDGDLRKYRTETPNVVLELGLGPQAGWLYVHLKRIAGDAGVCWRGTWSLAEVTGMSVGAVSRGKKELRGHGLIAVSEGDRTKGEADEIRVVNVWRRNFRHFDAAPVHEENTAQTACSKYEQVEAGNAATPHPERVQNGNTPFTGGTPFSQYERKKEPLEETTKESLPNGRPKKPGADAPPPFPRKKIARLSEEEAGKRFANLCDRDPHGEALRELAAMLAEENSTGQVAVTRVWRELGLRYLADRERHGLAEAAWAHGFATALTASVPNIGYVTKAARNHRPDEGGRRHGGRGRDSIAVVGATDNDYREEEYRFHA